MGAIIINDIHTTLKQKVTYVAVLVFLGFGFLLYVDGHGLHLSSNSIARLLQDMKGSELFKANYLFDEIISHYMWDTGVFLISMGLILLAYKISIQSISGKNAISVFRPGYP